MHKIILKFIILTLILSSMSGCAVRPRVGPPWMAKMLNEGPKDGSELFKKGWHDGCWTGISGASNRLQRGFYQFKQDYELSQNQEYYAGWKVAYNYCSRYVFQYLRRHIL